MKLTFCGGAQSVTGSNYLLEVGETKVLVDCGMFQGLSESEDYNYAQFPYSPADIAAVFITHSHADHTGRLPKLYRDGFRGALYATPPTVDMTAIALPDNLGLLDAQAHREGRTPLYNQADLDGVLALAHPVPYGQAITIGPITAVLHDAGHILGSAIIEIRAEGKIIYFSGDLGNPPTPLLKPFEYPLDADYIVVDSAYGDRIHEDRNERKQKLRYTIKETITRGGVLMIPSFAMERTQELLYELDQMVNTHEIPRVPMFVDSPLAIHLTAVYQKYPDYFNTEAGTMVKSGDDLFHFPGLRYTESTADSKAINDIPAPKVIMAGSGMSGGGRILHHESRYLSDPNSTILFIGFQAQGTLGRRIFDGAKEVKIFNQAVPVRCHVQGIGGYSAHADQPMILSWLAAGKAGGKLKRVFAVQGEATSASTLAEVIKERLEVDALAPLPDQTIEL